MFKMDASKLGVKKYICTECDESYTETIDALGHKYVDTVIKQPKVKVDIHYINVKNVDIHIRIVIRMRYRSQQNQI